MELRQTLQNEMENGPVRTVQNQQMQNRQAQNRRVRQMSKRMFSPRNLKLAVLALLLIVAGAVVSSCRGSKADVRTEETAAAGPVACEVTTAAAIKRDLPRFFEAT